LALGLPRRPSVMSISPNPTYGRQRGRLSVFFSLDCTLVPFHLQGGTCLVSKCRRKEQSINLFLAATRRGPPGCNASWLGFGVDLAGLYHAIYPSVLARRSARRDGDEMNEIAPVRHPTIEGRYRTSHRPRIRGKVINICTGRIITSQSRISTTYPITRLSGWSTFAIPP
jgi:hypothetical protein